MKVFVLIIYNNIHYKFQPSLYIVVAKILYFCYCYHLVQYYNYSIIS